MGKSNKNNKTGSYTNKTGSYTEFFYHFFRNILFVGIPLVIIFALILGFAIPHSSAEGNSSNNTSSDSLSISISSACTLSSSIDRAHTVNVNAGTHTVDIGSTRVNAYCNDNNGYSIYAIGNSNNVDGNTDLISSNNDGYNIKTGIYDEGSSSSLTPSSWGMKLAPGIGTGLNPETGASIATTPPTIVNNYDNYNIVPSSYTLVASRASGTNMTMNTDITGSYFTTTYDVYASSVQPAGTYNGKVKYLMVHPISDHTTITFEDAFARAGKQPIAISSGTYYKMQDMTSDICSQVAYDTTTELVDIRDNKPYYITKLKDNHCWMTQNLDLDIGGTGVAALTSENTDISTTVSGSGIYNNAGGYAVDSNNVWTWTPAPTAITANHTINNTSVSNWNDNNTAPYSVEGGDVYYYTSNNSSDDITYDSLTNCTQNGHNETNCKHYHRGNYYNWTAAIASNNSNGFNAQYGNAANSICPKGWRLPIATNADKTIYEFGELLYKQGITTTKTSRSYTENGSSNIRKSPLWFVRSGYIFNKTLFSASTNGYYWSSTVFNSTNAYSPVFSISGASLFDYYKGYAWQIRCLAR